MSRARKTKRGFTLVELLVVIAIIGVLVALLLPAVQAAREAARRMQCSNNLKQLGLALHNYHDVNKVFPYNGMPEGDATHQRRRGASWIVRILPFMEQNAAYDQMVFSGDWSMQHGPSPNQTLVGQLRIPSLNCPSTPLPLTRTQGSVTLQATNYVSICGSYYKGGTTATVSTSPGSGDVYPGRAVYSGVIINIEHNGRPVGMHGITDGTSNTIMVSEQSDFQINPADRAKVDRRASGHDGSTWSCGQGTGYWTQNGTTIRYPIAGGYGATGNTQPYDLNIPLFSAHPGGVLCTLADGSVRFVSETIDFAILTALADRADGNPVGEF